MKALSLWQPWASLIAVGAKRIETRSWSTDYRGLVAIHAAKRFQQTERLLLGDKRFFNALSLDYDGEGDEQPTPESVAKALPLGCFVAVGLLRHCLSTTRDAKFIPSQKTDEFWFGDYSPGRFMWAFDEIWKLSTPVYAIGARNLWTVDDRAKEVIFELLPEEVEVAA